MAERQGRLLLPMFALSIYYYTKDTTGMNIFERENYVGILYGMMFAGYEYVCYAMLCYAKECRRKREKE